MNLTPTASQTVGPYLHIGLEWNTIDKLANDAIDGEHVTIVGKIVDGHGKPVVDALIEVWQANAYGKYNHPEDTQDKPLQSGFRGFGRVPSDDRGEFRFTTIKPGPVPGPNGTLQAPHLLIGILMRGLLKRLVTRLYFPGESLNADDALLRLVPVDRRQTLIASINAERILEWNVVLQGDFETVFIDC